MRVLDPGHRYELNQLDLNTAPVFERFSVVLRFVKREGEKFPGNIGHYPGTTLQEVNRACIDRVKYVDNQISHPNNKIIIFLYRLIIWLLEKRAFERHNKKFELPIDAIENLEVNGHGHLWREN